MTEPSVEHTETEESLRTIAKELWAGRIFSIWNVPERDIHLLPMIFLALGFISVEGRQKMLDKDLTFLYEHMSEAGPRAINGYPCFMSFHSLSRNDEMKLAEIYKKVSAAMDAL